MGLQINSLALPLSLQDRKRVALRFQELTPNSLKIIIFLLNLNSFVQQLIQYQVPR